MSAVEIVRGDASHVDALRPLWASLREHQGAVTEHWGPLRAIDDAWARRRKNYEDVLAEGGVLLLARAGERIVGYLIGEQEPWASPTWEWPSSFLAVVEIVVDPEHRDGGVGTALMAEAEREARERGVDALDLMVAAPNVSARAFYEARGFRADLVVYRKPLD